jgi:CheY-like chemotaxis protein
MKRILVIDDDLQMRQMLRQTLEREGYEVIEAPDGKIGLRVFRQSPTDLVITDIIMPEKNGIKTIIEITRDFPDVKIIAISGGNRGIDAQGCLSCLKVLRIERTFTKPFEPKELLEAIRELLEDAAVDLVS